MGSSDAKKEEFISQLLDGNWKTLFPTDTWEELHAWFQRQKEEKALCVRFTFYDPDYAFEKYAIHMICPPTLRRGRVQVKNLYLPPEDNPLGVPPALYKYPLYSMPQDLLQRSLRKRKKK